MVGDGNGPTDLTVTFPRAPYTEVLIKSAAIAIDTRLVNTLTTTNIVSGTVALKTAIVLATAARGWVI
jgi:hypothetical protein